MFKIQFAVNQISTAPYRVSDRNVHFLLIRVENWELIFISESIFADSIFRQKTTVNQCKNLFLEKRSFGKTEIVAFGTVYGTFLVIRSSLEVLSNLKMFEFLC